jgi:hypothetical protein
LLKKTVRRLSSSRQARILSYSIWHKLVHILLLKTPMSCSHSYLQVTGWLEIIIPCIHEMD